MQPSRFVAGLTPLPTAARVTKQRSALRMRVISSIISLVVLIVFIVLFRENWSVGWTVAIAVLWSISTAFWFTVSAVGLRNAKRDLAMIPEGAAFYLDHDGVEFVYPKAVRVAWTEMTAFKLKGRNLGTGPAVAVEVDGQEMARVPIAFLDATPAVIDSAARAYSLGSVSLDTEALDAVL